MKKMLLVVFTILAMINIASAVGHLDFTECVLPNVDFGEKLTEIKQDVYNTGDTPLTWSSESSCPYITVEPYPAGADHTIAPGERVKFWHKANRPMLTLTLPDARYNFTIIFTHDGDNSPLVRDVYITIKGSTVPVELAFFEAQVDGSDVHLRWITASETNNLGFIVERKSQSDEWEDRGQLIKGKGTSTTQNDYTFIDHDVQSGDYVYRLRQIDADGTVEYSGEKIVTVSTPASFVLQQNYPNPFNPTTTINYNLSETSSVRLAVYNSLGQEVATLVDGFQSAGNYSVKFNGSNLPSGVYFYRLETGGQILMKQMILTK